MEEIEKIEIFEAIDTLQMDADYDGINEVIQYAMDALTNDEEEVTAQVKE